MSQGRKLRILCLHGKMQNKDVFRKKLGRIPHKLRNLAELIIINAPYVLDQSLDTNADSDEAVSGRSWYLREFDGGPVITESLLESLDYIKDIWRRCGPFDGILGFSMGGTMAGLLASGWTTNIDRKTPNNLHTHKELFDSEYSSLIGLRFVMCAGAVDIPSQLDSLYLETQGHQLQISPNIKSLHIAGKSDTSVPISSSLALAQRFNSPVIVQHEEGHHIPMKAPILSEIVKFVDSISDSTIDDASQCNISHID